MVPGSIAFGGKLPSVKDQISALEKQIRNSEAAGLKTNNPAKYQDMRKQLAVLYGKADPNYQQHTNRVNPVQPGRDYDPTNFGNSEDAMAWIDKKFGSYPSYSNVRAKIRDKVKSAISSGGKYDVPTLRAFAEASYYDALGKREKGDQIRDKAFTKVRDQIDANKIKYDPNTIDNAYDAWQYVNSPDYKGRSGLTPLGGIVDKAAIIGKSMPSPSYRDAITKALVNRFGDTPAIRNLGAAAGGLQTGVYDVFNPGTLLSSISDTSELIYKAGEFLAGDAKTRDRVAREVIASSTEDRVNQFFRLVGNFGGVLALKNKVPSLKVKIEKVPVKKPQAKGVETLDGEIGSLLPNTKTTTPSEPEVKIPIQVEPQTKVPAKRLKAEPLTSRVEKMLPEDIKVNPDMQYRGKARNGEIIVDPNANVTSAYKNVDTYVTNQAGPITVFEPKIGPREIVNGHHRHDIAMRAGKFIEEGPLGDKEVPRGVEVRVLKESEGWTREKARVQGVLENIRDQKGNATDAAIVLREMGLKPDALKSKGVSIKGNTSRNLNGLMALFDEGFIMVRNGLVDERAAAGLGSVEGLSPAQQLAALRDIEAVRNTSFDEGVAIGKKIKERGEIQQSGDSGLFGDDPEFGTYTSTIATEAKLQSQVRQVVATKMNDLLTPVRFGDKLIDGEVINVRARKSTAEKFGTSAKDAKDRLEFMFDADPVVREKVTEQARKVLAGDINEFEATQEIFNTIEARSQSSAKLFNSGQTIRSPKAHRKGPEPSNESLQVDRPRQRLNSGSTNIKALAVTAAAVGLGIYRLDQEDVDSWLKEHGLPGGSNMAIAALGVMGAVAGRKFLANLKVNAGNFDLHSSLKSPKDLEAALPGGTMKDFMNATLTAHGDRTVRIANDFRKISDAGEKQFGKAKFAETEQFRAFNTKVRDVMEENLAAGRTWSEGLPGEWIKFVEDVKGVLDPILDRWEGLGGRIKVINDGTQQTKISDGASLRLSDGRYGNYLGTRQAANGVEIDVAVHPGANSVVHSNLPGSYDTVTIAPGETFGRPVYRLGEAYVPRFYTDEFLEQVQTGDAAFKKALREMVEKENGFTGLEADDAISDLSGIVEKLDLDGSNVTAWLANVAKERKWQLSKFTYKDAEGKTIEVNPYESSYLDAITKYVEKANLRNSVADNFGLTDDAINNYLNVLRADPATSGPMAQYAEKLVGRILGMGAHAETGPLSDLARVEGLYQTGTKLTGGTSVVSQVGDLLFPLVETGGKNVFKQAFRLLKDADFRDDIQTLSTAHNTYLADMFGSTDEAIGTGMKAQLKQGISELGTPGKKIDGISKFVNAVMTWQGFRAADSAMKSISLASVLNDAKGMLIKSWNNTDLTPGELRRMERYGVREWVNKVKSSDVDSVMEDPGFLGQITAKIRQGYQYSGAKDDLPLWMSHPGGTVAMRFKKPWYVASRFVTKTVMDEAAKGNFVPLGRFIGYGITIGAGSKYLKDLIRMNGLDDETRDLLEDGNYVEAAKRFFTPDKENPLATGYTYFIEKDRSMGLMGLLGSSAQAMYDAGSLGIYGETAPFLKNRVQSKVGFKSRTRIGSIAEPVSVASIDRMINLFLDSEGDNFADKKTNAWADAYEAAKAEAIPLRRITDFFDIKPTEVRRREANRELDQARKELPKDMPAELRKVKTMGKAIKAKILNLGRKKS